MDQQPPKRRGRPATGKTPMRRIRAGAIWDEGVELAKSRGEPMTALVLRGLRHEIDRIKRETARAEQRASKES